MRCDYCKIFETGFVPEAIEDRFGDMYLPELYICDECLSWIRKILGVRTRYVQMIKEIKDY